MPWTIVDSFGDSQAFWIYEIPRQAVGWCDYGILRRKQGDSILILLERAGWMRLRLRPEDCSTSRDKSSKSHHKVVWSLLVLRSGGSIGAARIFICSPWEWFCLPVVATTKPAWTETVFHVLEAGYPAAVSDRMQPKPKTLET